MKEKYEEIACDVVIFETLVDDVITTSGGNTGSKSGVIGGSNAS